VNLPTGPGPEGYKAVLARWRVAWLALREHTAYDLSGSPRLYSGQGSVSEASSQPAMDGDLLRRVKGG
jgi:hypothetical protein